MSILSISSRLLTTTPQSPYGNLFVRFLEQPNIPYPGVPDPRRPHYFTEDSIGLSANRIFLEVEEHHKICECPQSSPNVSESHPYVAPTYTLTPMNVAPLTSSTRPTTVPIVPQPGRCGIVPIPAPLVFRSTANAGQNRGEQEGDEAQASDAIAISLQAPRTDVIDYSMSNAWFPGILGGVKFEKLQTTTTGDAKRNKIICAVDLQTPDVRGVLNRPEESECLTLGGRWRQQDGKGKMNAFVYETYDPEKLSMHRGLGDSMSGAGTFSNDYTNENDPHKCQRCLEREALIRLERKKAELRSKKMLDRELRSYGSRDGYNWNQGNGDEEDEDMDEEDEDEDMKDEDEDEEMRDLDVDGLGIDLDGIIAQTISRSSPSSASSIEIDDDSMSSSQIVSYGDDDPYQNRETDEYRRYYDKCRIGVECKGVADVLLSGRVGFFKICLTLQYVDC